MKKAETSKCLDPVKKRSPAHTICSRCNGITTSRTSQISVNTMPNMINAFGHPFMIFNILFLRVIDADAEIIGALWSKSVADLTGHN